MRTNWFDKSPLGFRIQAEKIVLAGRVIRLPTNRTNNNVYAANQTSSAANRNNQQVSADISAITYEHLGNNVTRS